MESMPVQIGARVHSFTDPTGLLSDCHRRVEMFLGMLGAAANKLEEGSNDETRRLLESALHYFAHAAPKHTADEEESLFPRMRRLSKPEITSALETLASLEEEHRWAEPLHAEVEQVGKKYLTGATLSPDEVAGFRQSVARLAAMYANHIRVEEDLVFPLAARLLPAADKAEIAREMASRRDVDLNAAAKSE
jgi:hemerythrin-like domain-containing protein